MTRINTNVSSLVAQRTLARSNSQLQESLTRLSTGLRINVGKDDPAGLIASEVLRSDIISVQRAIANSERANQLIATADSALGQVSSLLNDIRGLVSEAANTGALSEEQVAANQLQVDSSLEAIDRIAQTTAFQGRRLLDGSLDFITNSSTGTGFASGVIGSVSSAIASGQFGDVDGVAAAGTINKAAVQATGTLTNGADTLIFTAVAGGTAGNDLDVSFVADASAAGSETIDYNSGTNGVTIHVHAASTTTQIRAALNASTDFNAAYTTTGAGGAVAGYAPGNNVANITSGGLNAGSLTFTAKNSGSAGNGLDVTFVADASAAGSETVNYNSGTKGLTVHVHANSTTAQIITALQANASFDSEYAVTSTGTRNYAAGDSTNNVTSGGNDGNRIALTATGTGAAFNNVDVIITTGAAAVGSETAVYNAGLGTLTIDLHANSTVTDVVAAINDQVTQFSAARVGTGNGTFTAGTSSNITSGGVDGNEFTLTALTAGADYDNVTVNFTVNAALGVGNETAAYDAGTKTLTLTVDDTSDVADLIAAIDSDVGTLFSATAVNGDNGVFTDADDALNATTGGLAGSSFSDLKIDQANFGTASQIGVQVNVDQQAERAALTYAGGTLSDNLVLQVGGKAGFEVFNFGTGTTIEQIETALNLVSDATGVSASVDGTDLILSSNDYGSSEFVSARALTGTFATEDTDGNSATRASGSDIAVRINGVQATGDGLNAKLNTATLDLSFTLSASLIEGSTVSFAITGGGANFQLGPDVVSNQQARLGIQGVSTSTLGGVSGKLFELRTGGGKELATDVKGAARVVDEVITAVTSLRGRLGAFQRTTLDTNIASLNDTLTNLTDAESSIRDADFAAESARLTRAQILVQSGTSVLAIANSNPQNVLALLRG